MDDQKDGCDCNVCEPLSNCADCVASDEVCVWTGSECKSERADGAACDGKSSVTHSKMIFTHTNTRMQVLLERTVIVLATPLKSQIQITQQQIRFPEFTVPLSP